MRDTQLMGLGWEVNTETGEARLLPDGEWLSIPAARIAAGLDPAPAPPKRITIMAIGIDGVVSAILELTFTAGTGERTTIHAGIEAPLTTDERAALNTLLDQIAARLDQESR